MSKFQPPALPSQSPSFPPIAYRDVPVLTTDMLAQAYEVEAKQIRQNFANNRDRFVEGKHFFMLSGNNLREFKNCVENFDSVQIGKRAQSFTLWTERGAARHAKMLNYWKIHFSGSSSPPPSPLSSRSKSYPKPGAISSTN